MIAAAAAALILLLAVPHAGAAQTTLQLPAFIEELDRLLSRIRVAEPGDLPGILDVIPVRRQVQAGDAQYEVSFGWLRRSIEDGRRDPSLWHGRRSFVVARLDGMRREASAFQMAGAPAARRDASGALARVLARDEFRRNATDSATARLRQWILGKIADLWLRLGGERLDRRVTAIVVAWVVGLGALIALVWILVRLLVGRSDHAGLSFALPPSRRKSARRWALEALAAQDPRDVARCAYRAAVIRLEEEGAWRMDDARTPREHLRLLPAGHRRRKALKDIVARFEEIWYGARQPSADDTREMLARLRELGCLPAE